MHSKKVSPISIQYQSLKEKKNRTAERIRNEKLPSITDTNREVVCFTNATHYMQI